MTSSANYITSEKKKALEAELKELKGSKRKEILEALAYAKSLGDLSENAEYHQTREEQGMLENRIRQIEEILRSSEIISGGGGDTVRVGSSIVVRKVGSTEEKTYQIVGSEEADMAQGKISNNSPFGDAVYGKKKDDTFSFETPRGPVNYKIIKVF